MRDAESGAELLVRADNVINATGVWADRIRPDELHSEAELPTIVPSRGTHVTVSRLDLPLRAGAIVPAGNDRSIFALPWLGASLLGTTDNTYDGDIDRVRPAAGDIDYLLEATNSFFGTSLGPGDMTGAYAGVRPLISSGDARRSVDISRKAELYETSSGLITITGGKLTTWRRMAKLVVDRLVERDGREAPCRTQEIPLGEPVDPDSLPRVDGVPEESYAAMAARYGHAAHDLLALAGTRTELAAPIVAGHPDLLAEAPFSASREQALSVGDVLLRRTRLGLVAARAIRESGGEVPVQVARAMGAELGWDEARVAVEARRFDRGGAGGVRSGRRVTSRAMDEVYEYCVRMLGAGALAIHASHEAFVTGGTDRIDRLTGAVQACRSRAEEASASGAAGAADAASAAGAGSGDGSGTLADSVAREVADATAQLPPDQREALALRDLVGLSHEQIATRAADQPICRRHAGRARPAGAARETAGRRRGARRLVRRPRASTHADRPPPGS